MGARKFAAGLLAAIELATPAALSAQTSDDGPRLTSVTHATDDDLAPTHTYSAPYLLVDPANEKNVVAAAVEMRTRVCRLLRSTDAGQSWTLLDALSGLPSYPFCFNTAGMQTETPIAWGRGSTLHYGLNGWGHPGRRPAGEHQRARRQVHRPGRLVDHQKSSVTPGA